MFEASSKDVSRADVPAQVVGRTTVENPQWPVHLTIPFEASDIGPEGIYAERARVRVRVDGQFWITSYRLNRVLDLGASSAGLWIEIPMRSVARAERPPPGGGRDPAGALPAHGLRLPASFLGELPCADCQGGAASTRPLVRPGVPPSARMARQELCSWQ